MRIYSILFTLVLLISSCGSNEEKIAVMEEPEDLIAQENMIQIIADVHLLEAALQYRAPRGQSITPFTISAMPQTPTPANVGLPNDQKTLPYYDIFTKHNVTRDQYERSLQWYMTDAALYGVMYDEVINELVRRQAVEQQGGAQPKADSAK
jgi:hypothetical protein